MRLTWIQPDDVLRHELVQAAEEGKEVGPVRDRWIAGGGDPGQPSTGVSPEPATPELAALARELLAEVERLPTPSATDEPDDLEAIRATWTTPPALPSPDRTALPDRLHGAWLGRAIGCLLGKPVEKIPRQGIRAILEATGHWPLDRYFTAVGLPPDVTERWPWNKASRTTSLEENIDGMPEDDDLNYALIALALLERVGPGFTTEDVGESWLRDVPALRTFTAERIAYRNLLDGVPVPSTATVGNPYREWIGAQIRTDAYGWARPGDPHGAAELAWRDARLSHTRNGVYGAMWVAAMAATALVTDDVEVVLDAGASVVPPRSRLAAEITAARALAGTEPDTEAAVDEIYRRHEGRHWVHVLNNASVVAFALAAGGGQFERSITLTVMAGWDTDSNGATVGAVVGALAGAPSIPARWSDPLRNRLATSVTGFDGIGFDELARRTLAVATLDA
jgi:ADP-ribosylglycohydrolase